MSEAGIEIVHACSSHEVDEVRQLLREYVEFIAVHWPDVDRASFQAEIDGLCEMYGPPGTLLLAKADGRTAGCLMMRELEPGVVEARRLFVREEFRRRGVARLLMRRLMAEACGAGYERMRLVTVTLFTGAIPLYESLGFHRIEPYRDSTVPIVVFMERPVDAADCA